MIRKAVRVLLIPFVLFFSFQLLSIGLPEGIPVVILIAVAVLLLTGKKEEVINAVEAAGRWGQERAEIASVIAVQGGKVIASGIKAGYTEMGGDEGARKAVDELSKGAEEVLKIGGYAAVKTAEAVGSAVKAVGKQIQKDKKRERQENLLEDTARYVNFVATDDD